MLLEKATESSLVVDKQQLNVIIKKHLPVNFEELVAIDQQCFNVYDGYDEKTFKDIFKKNPNSFFVLFVNDSMAGYFIIYPYRKGGYIESIAILPPFQGMGLGSYMMEYIIAYFNQLNYKHITLEVRPSNWKAVRMYEKYGFQAVKILKNYYKDGSEALLMKKLL